MKKIFYLPLLTILLVAVSCSTTKVERSTQKGLKGDWILSSITTDKGNIAEIKQLFNQASPDCFEGSNWHFVSNNNTGVYAFANAGCTAAANNIKWFMEEEGSDVYFWWKFISEGVKAKDVKTGYKMKLMSQSETAFDLSQEAPFENEKITIYYHFTK